MDKPHNHKLTFIDLETGGLNPLRHPIIQIAAIAVDGTIRPLEAIEIKIKFDETKANKSSLRKNHYSRGRWATAGIAPLEAADALAKFLARHATHRAVSSTGKPFQVAQLVAHNAAFDGAFLRAWYRRLKKFLPARFQVLCTMQRAQWYFAERPELEPPANYKLATLCAHFGIPHHAADAHDALHDVTATMLLYHRLAEAMSSRRFRVSTRRPDSASSRGQSSATSARFAP